jgi:CRISPR-associated endoribonuclease Cas2 subtype I-E
MTVIVVSRVTPALRGLLSRWMLQAQGGVFVGHLTRRVRDRVWESVLGLKRLGACTMIARDGSEQGFSIVTIGDSRRSPVDFDGLTLIKTFGAVAPADAVNPTVEGCRGDSLAKEPDEAAKGACEGSHPERTVLPNGGA